MEIQVAVFMDYETRLEKCQIKQGIIEKALLGEKAHMDFHCMHLIKIQEELTILIEQRHNLMAQLKKRSVMVHKFEYKQRIAINDRDEMSSLLHKSITCFTQFSIKMNKIQAELELDEAGIIERDLGVIYQTYEDYSRKLHVARRAVQDVKADIEHCTMRIDYLFSMQSMKEEMWSQLQLNVSCHEVNQQRIQREIDVLTTTLC